MTCPACESFKQRPHSGAYHMHCLECCARLVASARPSRQQQEVMLAAIARYPDAPKREAVIERVRQMGKG